MRLDPFLRLLASAIISAALLSSNASSQSTAAVALSGGSNRIVRDEGALALLSKAINAMDPGTTQLGRSIRIEGTLAAGDTVSSGVPSVSKAFAYDFLRVDSQTGYHHHFHSQSTSNAERSTTVGNSPGKAIDLSSEAVSLLEHRLSGEPELFPLYLFRETLANQNISLWVEGQHRDGDQEITTIVIAGTTANPILRHWQFATATSNLLSSYSCLMMAGHACAVRRSVTFGPLTTFGSLNSPGTIAVAYDSRHVIRYSITAILTNTRLNEADFAPGVN